MFNTTECGADSPDNVSRCTEPRNHKTDHIASVISHETGHAVEVDRWLVDPYAALGRLTVEMYLWDSQLWAQTLPTAMVAAIEAMCTAEVDDDGILQHPGETCPVCDAKVGEGQA